MSPSVRALRRYPVKSMLGEELTTVAVTERGLAGDRAWALLDDESGRVASAKLPRRWKALLSCAASTVDGTVLVTTPGAAPLAVDDPRTAKTLSDLLGRSVSLVDEPPAELTLDRADPDQVLRDGVDAETEFLVSRLPAGRFHDFGPVHLVSAATVARIGTEVARYRPNIVLDTPDPAFGENDWVGRELEIGEVLLRVTVPTPRCSVPTLAHGELPRDLEALRVPAAYNRVVPLKGMAPMPCVGVYADVLRPGRVSVGDEMVVR